MDIEILYKDKLASCDVKNFKTSIIDGHVNISVSDLYPRAHKGQLLKYYHVKILSCVYVLWQNNEVVYVGQSRNLFKRILNHKDKKYNRISVLQIKEPFKRTIVEAYLINYFQPKYNKELTITED